MALSASAVTVADIPTSGMETTKQTQPVQSGSVVDIKTTLGDIKVLLYDDTPRHRDNFLRLAGEGFYDGVLFHRVIKDFMVQTGDPESRGAAPGAMLGAGDPGYTIDAEIDYPRHYHKYGAIAAARTGDQVNPERRSSGSQFYIVTGRKYPAQTIEMMQTRSADMQRQEYFRKLVQQRQDTVRALQEAGDKEGLENLRQELIKETMDNVKPEPVSPQILADYTTIGGTPNLDGQYTVFGEVLEGMDVVEKIQAAETDSSDRPKEDIRIISMKVEK